MTQLNNKKQQLSTFQRRLLSYNRPPVNVVLGFIFSFLIGVTAPLFGVVAIKCLFAMMDPEKGLTATESVLKYVLLMLALSVSYMILKTLNATAFVHVAENVTLGVRRDLY